LSKLELFPSDGFEVEIFHFGSGPGCFSEKSKAGFYGGIAFEAIDID